MDNNINIPLLCGLPDHVVKSIEPFLEKEKLTEIFNQWEYKPPSNPERLLYDFYFLTWAHGRVSGYSHHMETVAPLVDEAAETVVNMLKPHMLRAVGWSLSCEFRHIFDSNSNFRSEYASGNMKISDQTMKFVQAYSHYMGDKLGDPNDTPPDVPRADIQNAYQKGFLSKEHEGERLRSFKAVERTKRALGYKLYQFGEVCWDVFQNVKWNGSYGGPKWAAIGDAYAKLAQAESFKEKSIWIDHIYDLQHNTDTVFNKVKFYSSSGGYHWLKDALNWKAGIKVKSGVKKNMKQDIRDYYERVSPSLKPIVAFLAKNMLPIGSAMGTEVGSMEAHEADPDVAEFRPAFRSVGESTINWLKEADVPEVEMDKLVLGTHYVFMSPCPLYHVQGSPKKYLSGWLNAARERGIKTIVVLLSGDISTKLTLSDLMDSYKKAGFNVIHFPIRDFSVPQDIPEFHKFMARVAEALTQGNILVHCMGGLGRTGLVVAALQVFRGDDPEMAIQKTRKARHHTIETKEQEEFITQYAVFVDKMKSAR